ncbi:hypothetical protein DMENIID0001_028100 [Sergentomyia squamirostris]
MIDTARKELQQKSIATSKLPEGQYYHILGVKSMKTRYGNAVLVLLPEGVSIWLPKSFVNCLDVDQLVTIVPSDNWEIAYLGKAGEDQYKFVNIDVRKKE